MQTQIKARNSSIDILKFVFALVIAALHFSKSHGLNFARGAYILVEGFFIISGYFLMSAAAKDKTENAGRATIKYVLKKYSGFALPLVFSALIGFGVRIAAGEYAGFSAVEHLPFLFFEIFPLQITGITTTASTGVSWYLSAMLLAILLLYPLAKKFKSTFLCILCPFAVCIIYGNFCSRFDNLNPILQPVFGSWITAGLLRAVAGMCLGCIVYALVRYTEKITLTTLGRATLSLVVLCCLGGIAAVFLFFPKTVLDFIAVILLFVLIYILFAQKSLLSHALTSPKTKILGDMSLLIYLNHSYWGTFTAKKFADFPMLQKIGLFILLTAISCCIVNAAVFLTKRLSKKFKNVFKKLFIEA